MDLLGALGELFGAIQWVHPNAELRQGKAQVSRPLLVQQGLWGPADNDLFTIGLNTWRSGVTPMGSQWLMAFLWILHDLTMYIEMPPPSRGGETIETLLYSETMMHWQSAGGRASQNHLR